MSFGSRICYPSWRLYRNVSLVKQPVGTPRRAVGFSAIFRGLPAEFSADRLATPNGIRRASLAPASAAMSLPSDRDTPAAVPGAAEAGARKASGDRTQGHVAGSQSHRRVVLRPFGQVGTREIRRDARRLSAHGMLHRRSQHPIGHRSLLRLAGGNDQAGHDHQDEGNRLFPVQACSPYKC